MQMSMGDLRELLVTGSGSFFEVGKCYMIRTVTFHLTGRVIAVNDKELLLEDAAWIAASGRYSEFLKTGEASELEALPGECIVSRLAICDAQPWHHKLPRETK